MRAATAYLSRVGEVPRLFSTKLARTSSVYVVSNLINSAAPFLLLPVLTRYLSPAEFGTAAMFLLAVSLIDPLMGFSTGSAVSRRYFDRDEIDLPGYVGTCCSILAITLGVICTVLLLFGEPLAALLSIPAAWLWGAVAVAAGRYLVSLVLLLWQVAGKTWWYAALSFAQPFATLLLAIWFVVALRLGWTGRALGEVVSLVTLGLIAVALLIRGGWVRFRFDARDAKDAMKFGAGLVPHAYGALLIVAADRFLIAKYIGLNAVGMYVVGAQIAMVITVLERSFNLAWSPWLFGKLKHYNETEQTRIRQITIGYNVSILALALLLSAVAPWLVQLIAGPDYAGAAAFIFWLALGAAFTGMYKMVVNPIFFHQKTHLLAVVTFSTGVLNVLLTIVLIRVNGALGAAQAAAVSLFFSYVLTKVLADRVQRAAA